MDGSRAVAFGDGLRLISAGRPAVFSVDASKVGMANLAVKITCKCCKYEKQSV